MARFFVNRRWAFILALGVSLTCCIVSSAAQVASADLYSGRTLWNGSDSGGSGSSGFGDPDLPAGGGKTAGTTASRATSSAALPEVHVAGDNVAPGSLGWWRLRVALQSLRIQYFHF
jgi:hypothetical protein